MAHAAGRRAPRGLPGDVQLDRERARRCRADAPAATALARGGARARDAGRSPSASWTSGWRGAASTARVRRRRASTLARGRLCRRRPVRAAARPSLAGRGSGDALDPPRPRAARARPGRDRGGAGRPRAGARAGARGSSPRGGPATLREPRRARLLAGRRSRTLAPRCKRPTAALVDEISLNSTKSLHNAVFQITDTDSDT